MSTNGSAEFIVGALYEEATHNCQSANKRYGPFRYLGFLEKENTHVFKCTNPREPLYSLRFYAEPFGIEPLFVWRCEVGHLRNGTRAYRFVSQPYDPLQEPEEDCL